MLSEGKKEEEGFRMKGSDWDTMAWLNDHRVIWNMSQSYLYSNDNRILILSEVRKAPWIYFASVIVIDPKPGSPYCMCQNK